MKASIFWKTVVADRSDFLERLLTLLEERSVRYCVIGGQGVNAYADPVVSLDLDIVVALCQVADLDVVLSKEFKVERLEHSLKVSSYGSDLRLQIQTDPRYFDFVDRAQTRDVLGMELQVGGVIDVLQGKVWAASDPTRRTSTRLKDIADIARIVEVYPELIERVPSEIRDRIV
jgi:hypothetical protein